MMLRKQNVRALDLLAREHGTGCLHRMDLASLLQVFWIKQKAKEIIEEDPCKNMTPGSPAWLACKEAQRK